VQVSIKPAHAKAQGAAWLKPCPFKAIALCRSRASRFEPIPCADDTSKLFGYTVREMSLPRQAVHYSANYGLALTIVLFAALVQAVVAQPADFGLDLRGQPIRRLAGPGVRVVVLVFAASDCPISSRYVPEIARLTRRFSRQGVPFFGQPLGGRDVAPLASGTDQAVKWLEGARRADPASTDTEEKLTFAYAQQGRLPDALVHLREAVRLKPQDALPHTLLSQVLGELGQTAEAVAEEKLALQIDSGDADG
jgi:tetratricopeptide (TPR) repeat protein